MFLQVSVCPHRGENVHGKIGFASYGGAYMTVGHAWHGRACMMGCMHDRCGGVYGRGHAWQGVCMPGDMHDRGMCAWQGHRLWGMAGGMHGVVGSGGGMCTGETATEAGGTQSTGMHSCLTCFFTMYRKYTKSNWKAHNHFSTENRSCALCK